MRTTADLDTAIDAWRAHRGARTGSPSSDVTLDALYEQRSYLVLSANRRLASAVVARLPATLRARVASDLAARRELARLARGFPPLKHYRVGRAERADRLRGYYREAQQRFGVRWSLLAAVNFVESAFNKLRNNSGAGAQGPMQFMPATWRAYGLGGDIHDPHDAILGAANYLHANGAPRDNARALYHYNPSPLYVDAVLRYERRIRTDPRAFYEYYAWQVYVRTSKGLRRITGPGR